MTTPPSLPSPRTALRRRSLLLLALGAAAMLPASASAATGQLQTSKGGYRDVANNSTTGFALGLPGATMEASTQSDFSGTPTPFPLTDASGATSLTGLTGGALYYVREKTAPAGWEKLEKLDWGGTAKPYVGQRQYSSFDSRTVQIDGVSTRFVNRLTNPALPSTCGVGLKVLLLLDTSGSTRGFNDAYNQAAKTFVDTLAGTNTSLKISSFATKSSPGMTAYDLSTPAGQTSADGRIDAIYPNNFSGTGSTNWDAALQDAAKADVDVIVFVTDGNPTVHGYDGTLGTGFSTGIADIGFGIASANLAKNPSMDGGPKKTMLAVGVGQDLGVDNLKAVSGPDEGDDWTTTSDPTALAETLKKIAQALCPADVAIEKTGDDTVAPNGEVSYQLTVTNKGAESIPFDALTVADEGATVTPPDPAPAELAPGESAIWTATRTADTQKCGSEFANTATVTLTLPGYEETLLDNNSSTWKTLIVCPVDLSVTKKGDATILPGGVIQYSIAVTNDGKYPVPFDALDVTDKEADAGSLKPESPLPSPAFLGAGETATWTATQTVGTSEDLCGTTVNNTAAVALLKTLGYEEADTTNNSYTFTTEVTCPLTVAINKTATNGPLEPGAEATYDVVVTNSGEYTVPFAAIAVTDPDAELTPPADTSPLAPGASRTWTATRQVALDQECGSTIENTASVRLADGNDTAGVDEVPRATSATATTSIICPVDVSIAKTTSQTSVAPGESVSYTVTVTNPSAYPVPFASIVVTDDGTTLTPPADVSDLAPGASRTWTATKAVAADAALCGTAITNTATVALTGLPMGVVDLNAQSGSASASGVTVAGGICTPPPPPALFRPATDPLLVVTKAGRARMLAGGRIAYRITVTNTGGIDAQDVILRDQPPRGLRLRVRPAGSTLSGRGAQWAVGTLAGGQSVTKTIIFSAARTARGRKCNISLASAANAASVRARACTTIIAARRPATPAVTG